ncbi:MAG: thioether cross-link-forming SCIFF peptide maturase [Oscillospiraceae bacterium]|mgnify:FL=1|nr:thioether cross-link-forming SCIFF peptide maturase [Oscillospiraceae bacterium]
MVHKFKQLGYNIVLDADSNGVHVFDDCAFDMLDHITAPLTEDMPAELPEKLSAYPEEDIRETYKELYSLYKEGSLFADDDYQKYSETMVKSPVKSMCLNVAHDCNLRCEYCFAQTGDFGGERCIMSSETGKKAIDFLIEKSANRENIELDFFGGEPLMAWDTVVETVNYARSIEKQHNKNFRFTITTNGVLLDDEKIDYINREMVNVVLSLDGRRETTDRIRKTLNGKSAYDVIVPKFQKLVAQRGDKDFYVRATFTKYNLDFTEDVLHLRDLGFEQLSAEPVVTDEKEPYALTEEDLPRIFEEYDRLCELMANRTEKKFNFFHFMVDLDQGPCAIKRLRGCGCGNDYVAVDPHGDIYPCHQFVGIDKWKMGNLNDGTFNDEIKTYFAKTHLYSKGGCADCWAKFYCSGGCNANSFIYEGDCRKPHKLSCELQRKRLECALALAVDKVVKQGNSDVN